MYASPDAPASVPLSKKCFLWILSIYFPHKTNIKREVRCEIIKKCQQLYQVEPYRDSPSVRKEGEAPTNACYGINDGPKIMFIAWTKHVDH
jgi:hypothetical protein